MNFTDRILVRMATLATRDAVFDQLAREHLLRAAYDSERMSLSGPFDTVYEEFNVGIPVPRPAAVQGFWSGPGGSEPREIRLDLGGLAADGLRVDALWRGAIVARTAAPSGRISEVRTAAPTPAIPEGYVVPTGVTYEEVPAPPLTPRALPIAIALMVREAGFSVTELLAQSKEARERLEASAGRPESAATYLRHSLVIGWILPAQTFTDADWPTNTNPSAPADQARERREVAGAWLAREGIGLIVA